MTTDTKQKADKAPSEPQPVQPGASQYEAEALDKDETYSVFRRGPRAQPSPLQPNVQKSIDTKAAYAIKVDSDEAAKKVIAQLRKAAKELSTAERRVSLQVKDQSGDLGRVVFKAVVPTE